MFYCGGEVRWRFIDYPATRMGFDSRRQFLLIVAACVGMVKSMKALE